MPQPRPLPADFAAAYRERMAELGFSEKPAAEWDDKAPSFSAKVSQPSPYTDAFIARMHLRPGDTLLDVGCGPGILALRLAPKVQRLYGLDYSSGMLQCLEANAQAAGLTNITPIHLSKEDSWHNVPVCDIVVSSRSGLDRDLATLFAKLSAHARRSVYFTILADGHFNPPQISRLLGQERSPYPGYIYALNILYQMGYDPTLSYITTPGRLADCTQLPDFLQRMTAAYGTLTPEHTRLLTQFFHRHHNQFAEAPFAMKWALLSWHTGETAA